MSNEKQDNGLIRICTAILPSGKQCGNKMERYELPNDQYYFICAKCGNMK